MFIDDQPVDDRYPNVYAYVKFSGAGSASYGLSMTLGPWNSTEIGSASAGYIGLDDIAPLTDLADAINAIAKGSHLLEEYPFSEIRERKDYNSMLRVLEILHEDGDWKGPGVYDMRDRPPTRSWASVGRYENAMMEIEAESILDAMDEQLIERTLDDLLVAVAIPFAVGDRIRLIAMPDDPRPLHPGTEGGVTGITHVGQLDDQNGFWQVQVKWDSGSHLMLSIPPDEAMKVG